MVGNDEAPPVGLERAPRAELAGLVRRLWYLDAPARGRVERILPIPYVHVIVNLGEPYRVMLHGREPVGLDLAAGFVSGLQSSALVNLNPERLHHVGAELEPWAWRAFGAEPVADAVEDASRRLPAVADLRDALVGLTGDDALDRFEAALADAAVGAVDPVVVDVGRRIAADPGARISAVAEAVGTDPASVARRFRRATGTTPKVLARIHRLHAFVSRLAVDGRPPTWSALVADAPYYDQPHFNRDFSRMVGLSPREYLELLGDDGRAAPAFVTTDIG